jgi:heme/copper-type cytochrome/quinol oxidase subunit 2
MEIGKDYNSNILLFVFLGKTNFWAYPYQIQQEELLFSILSNTGWILFLVSSLLMLFVVRLTRRKQKLRENHNGTLWMLTHNTNTEELINLKFTSKSPSGGIL